MLYRLSSLHWEVSINGGYEDFNFCMKPRPSTENFPIFSTNLVMSDGQYSLYLHGDRALLNLVDNEWKKSDVFQEGFFFNLFFQLNQHS